MSIPDDETTDMKQHQTPQEKGAALPKDLVTPLPSSVVDGFFNNLANDQIEEYKKKKKNIPGQQPD
jgi:hypothetical protein